MCTERKKEIERNSVSSFFFNLVPFSGSKRQFPTDVVKPLKIQ